MDYRLVLLLALAVTFTTLLLSPQEASASYCGQEGDPCVQGYKKCCNNYHCNGRVCTADSKRDSKKDWKNDWKNKKEKNRNMNEAKYEEDEEFDEMEEMDRSVDADEDFEEEEEMDRSVDVNEDADMAKDVWKKKAQMDEEENWTTD